MEYLRNLRRVMEEQMQELIATLPDDPAPAQAPPCCNQVKPDRPHFEILDYIGTRRRVGRNWVARCPSCAAEGRDRSKDNLAISVEEPRKYICWAGCTKEQIRAALGAPIPIARR